MRWKSVALAGALAPAAGCNIYYSAARNIINEPHTVASIVGIEHELKHQAKLAWREVREQYPRRAFTEEFRDGFIDGYVDYLDRGGNGSTVAVPPARYTRHKKYFTPEGQCLMKHYLLGFQYGQDVAIATGRRSIYTVPVLLPDVPKGPAPFKVEPHGPTTPPVMPPPVDPPPVGAPPVPPQAVRPVPPVDGNVPMKFEPPVPLVQTTPAGFQSERPAAPVVKLPPPPAEVSTLPDHVPTPSVTDELPVVPPTHTLPPPVLPHHPDPTGK